MELELHQRPCGSVLSEDRVGRFCAARLEGPGSLSCRGICRCQRHRRGMRRRLREVLRYPSDGRHAVRAPELADPDGCRRPVRCCRILSGLGVPAGCEPEGPRGRSDQRHAGCAPDAPRSMLAPGQECRRGGGARGERHHRLVDPSVLNHVAHPCRPGRIIIVERQERHPEGAEPRRCCCTTSSAPAVGRPQRVGGANQRDPAGGNVLIEVAVMVHRLTALNVLTWVRGAQVRFGSIG